MGCCHPTRAPRGQPHASPVFRYPDFGRPRTTFKRDYDCAFTKDEFMGRGSFSEVYKGYDAVSGARVAIKRTRRSTMRWVDRVGMAMEVDILNEIVHPHVMNIFAFYEDDDYYYVVLEFLAGGQLLDAMTADDGPGVMCEDDAQRAMRQVCAALRCLHSHGIAHRDIKPSNIMKVAKDRNADVKLVDFGFAKHFDRKYDPMDTQLGTQDFMAPELFYKPRGPDDVRPPYSPAVDMWAAGVMTYFLLSGDFPFTGPTRAAQAYCISLGTFDFSPAFDNVSANAQDFITKLLTRRPEARMSAQAALDHPWLTTPAPRAPLPGVVDALREYLVAQRRIKGAQLAVLAAVTRFGTLGGHRSDAAGGHAAGVPPSETGAGVSSTHVRVSVGGGAGTDDGHSGSGGGEAGTTGSAVGTRDEDRHVGTQGATSGVLGEDPGRSHASNASGGSRERLALAGGSGSEARPLPS